MQGTSVTPSNPSAGLLARPHSVGRSATLPTLGLGEVGAGAGGHGGDGI